MMRVQLPSICYGSFTRKRKSKFETGFIMDLVEVELPVIEPDDAPIVLTFADLFGQSWDVRHDGKRFLIAAGFDDSEDSDQAGPLSVDDLTKPGMKNPFAMATMLRPLLQSSRNSLSFDDFEELFAKGVFRNEGPGHTDKLDRPFVGVDHIATVHSAMPSIAEARENAKLAYQTNCIIGETVWRACDEPRLIITRDYVGGNEYEVKVAVEVDARHYKEKYGVRLDGFYDEPWVAHSYRISRFDELEDLANDTGWIENRVALVAPSAPQILLDHLLTYDDDADMLRQSVHCIVSHGHGDLMTVSKDVILAWADLKESVEQTDNGEYIHSLNSVETALRNYGSLIEEEYMREIIDQVFNRQEKRPFQISVLPG